MKYNKIQKGIFLERPNRFLAYVEREGIKETVHVKNTGRCRELLIPGTVVYIQESDKSERKTKWDLIAVEKGDQMINMDSQIPNHAVKEWMEQGKWIDGITLIRPETTYRSSRFDLYVEAGERKIFVEVKGVTLEEDGVAIFPDAPSERAVKHIEELCEAVKEGYEAYVFFVIQIRGIRYMTPNMNTHPEFGDALRKAAAMGVRILAYDCHVKKDAITIRKQVPVVLPDDILNALPDKIVPWFRENRRDLPWRENVTAYRVWISEIMLQQTRVEAVKPFYERFLKELPAVKDLAEADEQKLLKLWEGLGYYNRVRNMQKAAIQIMEEFGGEIPADYNKICSLCGIGSYTAGAIGSFAFGIRKPAVDGNVLRVISRILGSREDIMKPEVRLGMEQKLELVIPGQTPGDFNQGLIELGAIICVPNGEPKCMICPARELCSAHREGNASEIPVRSRAKARRIEEWTVLLFEDGERSAIVRRPEKGLLAGMYGFPQIEGHKTLDEVIAYSKSIGLTPVRVQPLGEARHIFSHVEWHMTGYVVRVDELERSCSEQLIFAEASQIEEEYPIPSAYAAYTQFARIRHGQTRVY